MGRPLIFRLAGATLQGASALLFALDGFEKSLEIPLSKGLGSFALDDFKED
ncbi:MAG: hypothetical protein RLZZ02_711, partial [Bacteroidota bacterium]